MKNKLALALINRYEHNKEKGLSPLQALTGLPAGQEDVDRTIEAFGACRRVAEDQSIDESIRDQADAILDEVADAYALMKANSAELNQDQLQPNLFDNNTSIPFFSDEEIDESELQRKEGIRRMLEE